NFILFRTNNYTKFNPGPLRNVTVITADSIDLMTETASKLKLFNDVFSDNEPLFGDDQVRPIFEAMKIYCKDLLYNEQVKKIAEEIKYDGIFTESHDVCGQSMTHIYNIKPLFLMSPVPIPEHSAIEMGIPFNPNVVPGTDVREKFVLNPRDATFFIKQNFDCKLQ
uniref:Glucuronosyltransferase n=1 Tax=Bursaphelenchus xylophilus TaxID=6326 RepID=A0A1I7SHL1_BURXY